MASEAPLPLNTPGRSPEIGRCSANQAPEKAQPIPTSTFSAKIHQLIEDFKASPWVNGVSRKRRKIVIGTAAVAGTVVIGKFIAQETGEALGIFDNEAQTRARRWLHDPSTPQRDYSVIDHADVRQFNLNIRIAPSVREQTYTGIKLKVGDIIPNAVIVPTNPEASDFTERYKNSKWVAFKGENGKIYFADKTYLDPITLQEKPQ